jgi:hypothetical protein
VWDWNYLRRQRMAGLANRQFVPLITLREIDERGCSAAVWGNGMPTILPKVDYVFVGRYVGGEERIGLAPWADVADTLAGAGIDASNTPIDIDYESTPQSITQWVQGVPLIDPDAFPQLEAHQLLDEEAVAGAEPFLAGRAGSAVHSFPV